MGSLFSFCFPNDCFLFSCFTRKKDIPALKIHIYPSNILTSESQTDINKKIDFAYSEDIYPL